ncbi:MAG: MerR family transcriptional regulator [Gammaproteobacteria bacterium]|nr:MerR family transcriptional regulator [Gammaproteobacteria bacterium]
MYKVSEAASLAGVTVRALHHYDAIGLLRPSARSHADYRLYRETDIRALRRIRRYQALGFSLDEIQELLNASRKNRLDALRNQRDAVRQRATETADVVRAINREITAENGDGTQPPDRLGRAEALVSEYLERTQSGTVPGKSPLLAEALDVLRPLTTGPTMDAAAVRLGAWIHGCRYDWANVADLCRRFLEQTPDWDHRAFAALEVVTALTILERHEEAVTAHRAHIQEVMAERPGEEWADAMHNSTHGACWFVSGKRDAWVELFRKVDAGVKATPDNRASRYELLHTAVMAMGTDQATYGRDIDALVQRMADIIAEDPDWSERLWAEQRFEQQKVGNAVRRGDPAALTQAVDDYRTFLDGCTWPTKWIAAAYSNLGAILHWEGRHEQAVECFMRAQQEHELDGYGYAWFAGASLAAGAPRARVTELLAEAGRRLESADAMRIFNEDAALSADADKEALLDALLQPA